jgi:hypothetical protein
MNKMFRRSEGNVSCFYKNFSFEMAQQAIGFTPIFRCEFVNDFYNDRQARRSARARPVASR